MISAYVCGERSGLILEKPYHFGDSLNGVPGLDVDAEKKIVCDKLDELREQGATEDDTKVAMKTLGISRFVNFYIYKLPSDFLHWHLYLNAFLPHHQAPTTRANIRWLIGFYNLIMGL